MNAYEAIWNQIKVIELKFSVLLRHKIIQTLQLL